MAKIKERKIRSIGGASKADAVGVKYLIEVLTGASERQIAAFTAFAKAVKASTCSIEKIDEDFLEMLRSAAQGLSAPRFDELRGALKQVPIRMGARAMTEVEVKKYLSEAEEPEEEEADDADSTVAPAAPASESASVAPAPKKPDPAPAPASESAPASASATAAPATPAPKKPDPAPAPASAPAPAPAPDPAPASATTVSAAFAAGNWTGPGYAFKYWDAEKRFWFIKSDIWAAKQAGNGIYEPVWVWYEKGQIRRLLDKDEIERYAP